MLVEVLFYWGALQWFCRKLGGVLQAATSTTVCESVIAVGNVFLGMVRALSSSSSSAEKVAEDVWEMGGPRRRCPRSRQMEELRNPVLFDETTSFRIFFAIMTSFYLLKLVPQQGQYDGYKVLPHSPRTSASFYPRQNVFFLFIVCPHC